MRQHPWPLAAIDNRPPPAVVNKVSPNGKDFWIWGSTEHRGKDNSSGETGELADGTLTCAKQRRLTGAWISEAGAQARGRG